MAHRHRELDVNSCIASYEDLEAAIRKHLTRTKLSYRDIAASISWSHTHIWSFHKQRCKLQFDVLDRLALLFNEPYLLRNATSSNGLELNTNIEDLILALRKALDIATGDGISYRKIGENTEISHEWVRCFHIKEAKIEVRKLLSLADYIGVPYELSNFDAL